MWGENACSNRLYNTAICCVGAVADTSHVPGYQLHAQHVGGVVHSSELPLPVCVGLWRLALTATTGNPWEIERLIVSYPIKFYGHVSTHNEEGRQVRSAVLQGTAARWVSEVLVGG